MARREKTQRKGKQALLFVPHDSTVHRGKAFGTVISHARRTQLERKHGEQAASARREADYARRLVGWRLKRDGPDSTDGPKPGFKVDPSQRTKCRSKAVDLDSARQAAQHCTVRPCMASIVQRCSEEGRFLSVPSEYSDVALQMLDFCMCCKTPAGE